MHRRTAYIPTPHDKAELYRQLAASQSHEEEVESSPEPVAEEKRLSKGELDQLLARLTKVTRREHEVEQHAEAVLEVNQVGLWVGRS
jgi:hypothetical protein